MISRNIALTIISILCLSMQTAYAWNPQPKFRHVGHAPEQISGSTDTTEEDNDTVMLSGSDPLPLDSIKPRTVEQILESLPDVGLTRDYAVKAMGPWVISGYRPIHRKTYGYAPATMQYILGRGYTVNGDTIGRYHAIADSVKGSLLARIDSVALPAYAVSPQFQEDLADEMEPFLIEPLLLPPVARNEPIPGWLREAMVNHRIQEDMMYTLMVETPANIEFAYWDLPVPPRLPEDDMSFIGVLKKMHLPEVDTSKAFLDTSGPGKRHWLHVVNGALQFSQAYISPNWYQGGNDYLALLLNFLWDVNLNPVYHPNLMVQSTVSYKLGLNSTPKGSIHKHQISADLLQWNFKAGLKAYSKWYYSFNLQFKTQMLRNYEENTDVRTASFLSPGELNMGIGMTYNHQNPKKTFTMSLSISPASYNLKTCIDQKVDKTRYKIEDGKKFVNEIGSNIEGNFQWQIHSNISWRSRLFIFSDYKSILGDWENTFDFAINRFLSTQLFFNLRYDSSCARTVQTGWGRWQCKEILSFGLSYTFSTKP